MDTNGEEPPFPGALFGCLEEYEAGGTDRGEEDKHLHLALIGEQPGVPHQGRAGTNTGQTIAGRSAGTTCGESGSRSGGSSGSSGGGGGSSSSSSSLW